MNLARELGLCYSSIAAVTDYDIGLQKDLVINPNHMDAILEIFREDIQKTKYLLLAFIKSAPSLSCKCVSTVLKAYYEHSL
jgi:purine nucleoside phosphorylase